MGSATYTRGRTLNFRPITRLAEIPLKSTYHPSAAHGRPLDIQALTALSGAVTKIGFQPEHPIPDRAKNQPMMKPDTSVRPVMIPYYVRNNNLDLKEFGIF